MRTRATLLAVVLLAAGLAGCMGDDAGTETETASTDDGFGQAGTNATNETANETEAEEPEGPQIEAHWYNATLQGGAAGPYGYCAPGCDNTFSFPVENGSTAIVVEAAWEADGEVSTYVYPPCDANGPVFLTSDCPDTAHDTGSSPLYIPVTDDRTEITGDWDVNLYPRNSYTQQTEVTIAASVFYDGQPPDGFTKLAGGSQ